MPARRPAVDDPTSHEDLLMAIGEMRGEMKANFTTLFVQHRAMGDQLTTIRDRVVGLETENNGDAKPAAHKPKPSPWWHRPAAVAAIVAILGGVGAAYQQALSLVVAIGHALAPVATLKP